MTARLSKAVAAAQADPVFSPEDVKALDEEIRKHDPLGFPELTSRDLEIVRHKLNSAASIFQAQEVVGRFGAPQTPVEEITAIEGDALSILKALGHGPKSLPDETAIHHFANGIFAYRDFDVGTLVRSLQDLVACAQQWRNLQARTNVKSKGERFNALRWLYNDLGVEYMTYWGRGKLTVGVKDGKGGPAARYFQFTVSRILNTRVSADAVKQMIYEMKKEGDESLPYPLFV